MHRFDGPDDARAHREGDGKGEGNRAHCRLRSASAVPRGNDARSRWPHPTRVPQGTGRKSTLCRRFTRERAWSPSQRDEAASQSAAASAAVPASQPDDPLRPSVTVSGVGVNVSQTLPSGAKVTVPVACAPLVNVALTVHVPLPVPVTLGAAVVPLPWHGPDTVTDTKVRPHGAWMRATGTGPGGKVQLLLLLPHAHIAP